MATDLRKLSDEGNKNLVEPPRRTILAYMYPTEEQKDKILTMLDGSCLWSSGKEVTKGQQAFAESLLSSLPKDYQVFTFADVKCMSYHDYDKKVVVELFLK